MTSNDSTNDVFLLTRLMTACEADAFKARLHEIGGRCNSLIVDFDGGWTLDATVGIGQNIVRVVCEGWYPGQPIRVRISSRSAAALAGLNSRLRPDYLTIEDLDASSRQIGGDARFNRDNP